MEMRIPAEVEGLDREWFASAFAATHPDVRLKDARIDEVMDGTCTKIRIALEFERGRVGGIPPQVLVKGGFAEHSLRLSGMHLTEMRYYRDIAGDAVFDTPACYAALEDPQTGRAIVVLEDLSNRPVRWLNALEPLCWRDEVAFLDVLAGFAAQHWTSPEFSPGGRLDWVIDSYSEEAAAYIAHYLDPERWGSFIRLPRCVCLPKSLLDRSRMEDMLARLADRINTLPTTLSHGDTHLGNLYINTDGTPGFLDAQPRRASFIKDFTYQMIAALDIEDRRRWERPLLARFLRTLKRHGVEEVPSFDEAWHEYRHEIAYGLFIFMINESQFQREEINTANCARFGAAAIDHGTFNL